jgi:hypothetical protein
MLVLAVLGSATAHAMPKTPAKTESTRDSKRPRAGSEPDRDSGRESMESLGRSSSSLSVDGQTRARGESAPMEVGGAHSGEEKPALLRAAETTRERPQSARPSRTAWLPDSSVTGDKKRAAINFIKARIAGIVGTIPRGDIGAYKMKGAQKAHTHAGEQVFETSHQMHSEMMALAHQLETGAWKLEGGKIVDKAGRPIPPSEFATEEPHCGQCTVLMRVLGLPLTKPTLGLGTKAGNHEYPVPKAIRTDKAVLDALTGDVLKVAATFARVDKNTPPPTWEQVAANDKVINGIWELIWTAVVEHHQDAGGEE